MMQQIPDEIKLTQRIKHALRVLYETQQLLNPDEIAQGKLTVAFTEHIQSLRSKLRTIAGEAELSAFDQQYVTKTHAAVSDDSCEDSSRPGRLTHEQLAHELFLDPTFEMDESGGVEAESPTFQRIRESLHTVSAAFTTSAFWF